MAIESCNGTSRQTDSLATTTKWIDFIYDFQHELYDVGTLSRTSTWNIYMIESLIRVWPFQLCVCVRKSDHAYGSPVVWHSRRNAINQVLEFCSQLTNMYTFIFISFVCPCTFSHQNDFFLCRCDQPHQFASRYCEFYSLHKAENAIYWKLKIRLHS